jgi:hypothetical protein
VTTYTFIVGNDGKIPVGMRETLAKVFPSFAGKKVRLSVAEAQEKRSLDQNSYYWGVIVPHVRWARFEMGDALSLEQVHEDLLKQFAPIMTSQMLNGVPYGRPMRSKEMSVSQMANFITAITATMAEFGYPVPARAE